MPDTFECPINGLHDPLDSICSICKQSKQICRHCGIAIGKFAPNHQLWMHQQHECKKVPHIPIPLSKLTGFEQKSLRCTIENWIYNEDLEVRIDAQIELRRRFSKRWSRPEWLPESQGKKE